jgi:hemoglobin-like flavoprotein
MTAQHIKLVKKSWFMFRNIKPEIIADAFYSRLFLEHPELRPLFPKDMEAQYEKLISMLNIVVGRLDRLEELTQDIADLAVRHKDYGTKPAHYDAVGKALLWTLEMGLGNDWTEETAEAWGVCYTLLSKTMIEAAA